MFIAKLQPHKTQFTNTDKAEALGLLGLKRNASREEIIESYRVRMRLCHPDRGGDAYLATRINWAKDVLLSKAS